MERYFLFILNLKKGDCIKVKLVCLLNHTLTMDQMLDAYNNLKVDSIIYPPEDIKLLWRNIPVGEMPLGDYLLPVFNWIKQECSFNDFVLIQGDFGATYLTIRFCLINCFIPIYSTTKRIAREDILPSGEIKLNHIFLHQGFRIYGI